MRDCRSWKLGRLSSSERDDLAVDHEVLDRQRGERARDLRYRPVADWPLRLYSSTALPRRTARTRTPSY